MTEDKLPESGPRRRRRRRRSPQQADGGDSTSVTAESTHDSTSDSSKGAEEKTPVTTDGEGASPRRRRRRRRRPGGMPDSNDESTAAAQGSDDDEGSTDNADDKATRGSSRKSSRKPKVPASPPKEVAIEGILDMFPGAAGYLRQIDADLAEQKSDPMVPANVIKKFQLKRGHHLVGKGIVSHGHQSPKMTFLESIDGLDMAEHRRRKPFKNLTVIDPDFHYELGTHEGDGQISMRVVDLLSPIGRGQRGLLVAPPRTGKTTIMQQIAESIEALYPEIHLIVLLIDERPEEATYWKRAVKNGEVFVSTMDEKPKNHVRLAELVQYHAERLVETGKDVVILLDSITRLTRAYNNTLSGKDSKVMSGGLDARVFTKPKHFFGAARNTETAGSLTILATTLVRTGSKMDDIIFEEFKGTGNMELTLHRMLADRRIYPAIDIESTGTRKEEKLYSRVTMRKINILRRVLSTLRPREAVEMLIDRMHRYPSNQDFLAAFSLDDV